MITPSSGVSTARACLALQQHSQLTDKQLRILLLSVDHLSDVFELGPEAIEQLGLPASTHRQLQLALRQCYSMQVELDAEAMSAAGISVIAINDYHYPALLREIYDPPAFLFARGRLELLLSPQLAMVGSRRTSQQGQQNAYQFARAFAQHGFTVTSGLALGVDAESHRGALACEGNTIAVLGTGIDVVYPRSNRGLFDQIAEQGLILSEYPPGREAHRGQFPRRNRIISGLSLGVLVIEAAIQSGSLITARCGLEQGREVFALPGSIHNPSSRGCHALIRQGAKLVETVEHVMEELSGWLPVEQLTATVAQQESTSLPDEERNLLENLGFDPASVDELQQRAGLPMAELMAGLTQLELKGAVENISGRYQRIVS